MLTLALLLGVAAAGTAITWKGGIWLEGAADRLSRYYGLPAVVQGAIVAAVGSSFPELASVVIATLRYGAFEVGVAAVVGSAIFNVLVIPALATLAQGQPLQTSRDLVYKEAQFYLLSLAALFLAFALAVIYFPAGEDPLRGFFTREIAAGLLGLYALYVFIQLQDVHDHVPSPPPSIDLAREWLTLLGGLLIILVGVEGLVWAATGLGEYFDTPAFLWGLIVIAAGTSLPDAVISVRAARAQRHAVSLANVLGSNVFDLLVAVPVGVMLAGATAVNFDRTAPMLGFLVGATVAVFAAARTDFEITNREAYLLLALYLAFVGWMLLESTGLVDVVP